MIRIACNRNINTFMYKKFPSLLNKYLLSSVHRYKKDKKDHLDKLLKDSFKINGGIEELIALFIKNLKVNHNQNKEYYITVEDVEVNNSTLEAIVRAVDYGNSEFPPYKLFNTSLVFVNNNLEALYKYSYLGVN